MASEAQSSKNPAPPILRRLGLPDLLCRRISADPGPDHGLTVDHGAAHGPTADHGPISVVGPQANGQPGQPGSRLFTRVMIADDQALMRHGMVALLQSYEGLEVIGEASNGRDAIRRAAELRPDIILMDNRLPILDGIMATRQICRQNPEIRVILLSVSPDEETISRAIAAGACGILLKDSSADELVRAIQTARCGGSPLDPRVAKYVLSEYSRLSENQLHRQIQADGLSPREIEILRCVALGWSNKQIAGECTIAEKTVKTHLRNIFRKLDIRDRTQAAVYAVTRGL